jgi:DNA-binding MarR family transcriptional regulator
MAANSDQLQRSPVHLLHRAVQCAEDLFHGEMHREDLTPRQLAVLIVVVEQEGLSQTGLVQRTGIDRSTVADMVRRMQRKGLLQRRRTKADARAYAIKITDEGRRTLHAAELITRRVDQRILDALPSKKRERFVSALASIADMLQRLSLSSSQQSRAT